MAFKFKYGVSCSNGKDLCGANNLGPVLNEGIGKTQEQRKHRNEESEKTARIENFCCLDWKNI
jgi:hypothetical protein